FGIGHLTIPDAAQLVAVDLWFSGEFEQITPPENWDHDPNSPWLIRELQSEIKTIEGRLLVAVARGDLKTSKLEIDIDDLIIAEATWIDYDDLFSWFSARGVEL